MSLQRRNGQIAGQSTAERFLSESRNMRERSNGVLGRRAAWIDAMTAADKLEPDRSKRTLRAGRLQKPVRDPDGVWYTPEMDVKAMRLDREAKQDEADPVD